MDNLVFMGLLVSKYDIGATEEKVHAVLEPNRPTTLAEVLSFLRMVGLIARFIPNFRQLQSLYERSPGSEYPLYGAVSGMHSFRN